MAPTFRPPRRWPLLAIVVALVAIAAIAVGAWFRPLPQSPPSSPSSALTYNDKQVSDAKAAVCAAFEEVHRAIRDNFARDKGDAVAQQLAVAAIAQQALVAGSQYLTNTLAEHPATPRDLADAVRKLTDVYPELTIDYLNGVDKSGLDPLLRVGDEATTTIERLCK